MSGVAIEAEPDIITYVDGPAIIRLLVTLNLSEVVHLGDILHDSVQLRPETAQ